MLYELKKLWYHKYRLTLDGGKYSYRIPFKDIKNGLDITNPLIVDVGYNKGDVSRLFKKYLPDSYIIGFDPLEYDNRYADKIIHFGVGTVEGSYPFYVTSQDRRSSFVKPQGVNDIIEVKKKEIIRLDRWCNQNGVDKINVLKTDCEGMDLDVVKSAGDLLKDIDFVLMECTDNTICDTISFMSAYFDLFNMWSSVDVDGRIVWCDILFKNNFQF